jgi:hypothetical protein
MFIGQYHAQRCPVTTSVVCVKTVTSDKNQNRHRGRRGRCRVRQFLVTPAMNVLPTLASSYNDTIRSRTDYELGLPTRVYPMGVNNRLFTLHSVASILQLRRKPLGAWYALAKGHSYQLSRMKLVGYDLWYISTACLCDFFHRPRC